MEKHTYQVHTQWTGDNGVGTTSYTSYSRDFVASAEGKHHDIQGSSDPVFRGDTQRYNPEQLFVSALSSCHMLWYLHFCADSGVVVREYSDEAKGTMIINKRGSGQFSEVVLYPKVVIENAENIDTAIALHQKAHRYCFIANSSTATILCRPQITSKAENQ